jgi:hypothetical protein
MKNDLKMKFEKGKEKKRKTAPAPFGPRRPSLPPAPAHLFPSPFSFFLEPLTAGAHVSASPLPPFLSSFPCSPAAAAAALNPPRSRLLPFLSLPCEHAN